MEIPLSTVKFKLNETRVNSLSRGSNAEYSKNLKPLARQHPPLKTLEIFLQSLMGLFV